MIGKNIPVHLKQEELPASIGTSNIIAPGNLQKLLSSGSVPDVDPAFTDDRLKNIFQYYSINPEEMEKEVHMYANELLDNNDLTRAWQVLLAVN